MKNKLKKGTYFLCGLLTLGIGFGGVGQMSAKAEGTGEKRYYDSLNASPRITITETINYTSKEQECYELPNLAPLYYTTTLTNACGPVAGGIIVGYYDKYYEDLIPDYTAYYPASGKYKRPDSTYVPALLQNLYTLMRTNIDDVGVSETDCLNGLRSYVESKNRLINYSSIMNSTGTGLNETAYLSAINAQKPVLMFCNSVTLYDIYLFDNYDNIAILQTGNSHVLVGYAYLVVRYYNGTTNFRTDTYLEVSTGWSENLYGYLKISSTEWLDSGYAVDIY